MGKPFKEQMETRMVKVIDDWHPCYPNNEVCMVLKLVESLKYPGQRKPSYIVQISAWGQDDTGVELEYCSEHLAEVQARYTFWKKYIFDEVPDGVDKKWFYEHGFIPG